MDELEGLAGKDLARPEKLEHERVVSRVRPHVEDTLALEIGHVIAEPGPAFIVPPESWDDEVLRQHEWIPEATARGRRSGLEARLRGPRGAPWEDHRTAAAPKIAGRTRLADLTDLARNVAPHHLERGFDLRSLLGARRVRRRSLRGWILSHPAATGSSERVRASPKREPQGMLTAGRRRLPVAGAMVRA